MSMKSFVSIIIPVFNGEKYLKEAIESALGQTYKHCEVIVVDDGSTDDSGKIAQSYGDKIRYLKKKNGGVSTALNVGIKKAKGEYISWLSHDDVYAPEKIETQMKIANQHTICFSNYKIIDEQSRVIETPAIELVHNIKKFSNHLYPVVKGLVFGCTLLIPKKCFEEQGLFDEQLKTSQDTDMWLRLFPKYDIAFQRAYLLYSRRHAGQGTHTARAKAESNQMWIKIMKSLNDSDKKFIDGSVGNFYFQMNKQMNRVKYFEAAKYANQKLSELHETIWTKKTRQLACLLQPFTAKYRRILSKLS